VCAAVSACFRLFLKRVFVFVAVSSFLRKTRDRRFAISVISLCQKIGALRLADRSFARRSLFAPRRVGYQKPRARARFFFILYSLFFF